MKDPELQEAVEAFLRWAGDLTRCPACHKIRSQGHTAKCRVNALNAVLNRRVERSQLKASAQSAITDVRPLDVEQARRDVSDVIAEERQSEKWTHK